MGKDAKLKAQRNRFKKGDLIQLVRAVGFLPAGLYLYEGRSGNISHLSAGNVRVGIDCSFLEDCVPLVGSQKPILPIPTEQDFEAQRLQWLEQYRADNTYHEEGFDITPLTIRPEDVHALRIPERIQAHLAGKMVN